MERNKVNLKKTPKKENTKKPCNPLKSTLSQAMFTERLKKNGPRIKNGFPVFAFFQRLTRGKKIAQSFLLQPEL